MSRTEVIGVLGAGTFAGACVYLYKVLKKVNNISVKLNKTLDELEDMTEVEIKEEVVNEAIERKAGMYAERAIRNATTEIVSEMTKEMKKEIKKAVNEESAALKSSVKAKIEEEIKDLDIDEARQEVIEKAKDTAAAKFDDDLESILEKYNNNLNKVTDIYSAIAQKMNPKQTFDI